MHILLVWVYVVKEIQYSSTTHMMIYEYPKPPKNCFNTSNQSTIRLHNLNYEYYIVKFNYILDKILF